MPVQFEKTYERKRYVSIHVVEMLRTRTDLRVDFMSASDEDVGNQIDQYVQQAIAAGRFQDVNDRGVPARVVDLREELGAEASALIKTNDEPGSQWYEAIVTLLPPDAVARYMSNGRWGTAAKLGDVLGEKLRSVPVAVPADMVLVTWKWTDTIGTQTARYLSTEVGDRVTQLLADRRVDAASVEVWRKVKTRVKVEVDL
jgi:hypothetical protein